MTSAKRMTSAKYHKEQYWRRRNAGLCVKCGKKADDCWVCPDCLVKEKTRVIRRADNAFGEPV